MKCLLLSFGYYNNLSLYLVFIVLLFEVHVISIGLLLGCIRCSPKLTDVGSVCLSVSLSVTNALNDRA